MAWHIRPDLTEVNPFMPREVLHVAMFARRNDTNRYEPPFLLGTGLFPAIGGRRPLKQCQPLHLSAGWAVMPQREAYKRYMLIRRRNAFPASVDTCPIVGR